MTNKAKAINYINQMIPLKKDEYGMAINTDREILIDFILNPEDTCLFGRYQRNIYNDLVGMFNLPPIKLYEGSDNTYVLA